MLGCIFTAKGYFMNSIVSLFSVGGVLVLVAVALVLFQVIQGFRTSVRRGLLALVTPLLLASGVLILAFAAHLKVFEKIDVTEVRTQGQEEFEQQIEKLDQINPEDMQLDL